MRHQYARWGVWAVLVTAAFAQGATKAENLQVMQFQIGSNLALMAGNHILDAEKNLTANQMDKARDELIKASTILDVMEERAGMPSARARLAYADKLLETQSPQKVEANVAPVFAEIDIITDETKNKEAKKQLDKAMKSLKKGDRESARKELKEIDKLIVVKELTVPVKAVQKHLSEAITAIEQNNSAKAKQAVAAAAGSLREDVIVALDKEGHRAVTGKTTAE